MLNRVKRNPVTYKMGVRLEVATLLQMFTFIHSLQPPMLFPNELEWGDCNAWSNC